MLSPNPLSMFLRKCASCRGLQRGPAAIELFNGTGSSRPFCLNSDMASAGENAPEQNRQSETCS